MCTLWLEAWTPKIRRAPNPSLAGSSGRGSFATEKSDIYNIEIANRYIEEIV